MSVLGGVSTYTPFWIFQPLAPAGFRKCQPVRSLPLNREIQFGFFAWAECPDVISKQVSVMIRRTVLMLSPFALKSISATQDEVRHVRQIGGQSRKQRGLRRADR